VRGRRGYGSVLALGVFLSGLVLATLLLSALAPAMRVSSEASGSAKNVHEQKREGLRVFVWTYFFPHGGGRWQRPYLYLVVEGGYPVLVKDVIFLEAENRSSIDPVTGRIVRSYRLDRAVEPPCLMVRLDRVDRGWRTLEAFNRSVSHVAVVAEGKVYYGTVRMPNVTLAYPCAPDRDRNAFDLHIVASPAEALDQVSWTTLRGSCMIVERSRGNQVKLQCSAYSVVRLSASDSRNYVFEEWNVEGNRAMEETLTLVLDDDYTVNAIFRRA